MAIKKRYTEWHGDHAAVVANYINYIDQLARYEDTGLTPDEITALCAKQKAEKNDPLTLEELRNMAEQPYYHVSLQSGGTDHWTILPAHIAKAIEDYHYGEYWLAYRHPPKEVQDGN